MIRRIKAKQIIFSTFLVLVFIFTYKNYISADSNSESKLLSSKDIEVTIGGRSEKFSIDKYQNNSEYQYFLVKKNLFGSKNKIKLSGFENELLLCEQKVIKLQNNEEAICLVGDVGAHSQNVQIIEYSNGRFAVIPFLRESTSENITTDVPLFHFDEDSEKTKLIIDQRNYDLNPLNSAIRSFYEISDKGFVFDEEENITYN